MHLRPVLGLLLFGLTVVPAAAQAGSLEVTVSGYIADISRQSIVDSDSSFGNATTGPLGGSLAIGILVDSGSNGNDGNYEYSLTGFATARADYGLNGALAGSESRLGSNPADPFINLYSPTFEPTPVTNLIAESEWRDGFVITGGTGFDTMSVTIDLAGRFYHSPAFGVLGELDVYVSQTSGTVNYDLSYQDFFHAGGETGFEQSVISWNRDTQSGFFPYQETLVGTFSFEYGVPFELAGGMSVSSAGNGVSDFLDTASLTHFTLPAGATLVADSGSYAVVPEPASAWLLGLTVAGLLSLRQAKKPTR